MCTIPSTLASVQTYAQASIKYLQDNLKIDQSTQDKVYAVALNVMNAIAFVATSAAIVVFSRGAIDCLSGVSPALPGAVILTTFLALSAFCKPASADPSYSKADSDARAKEWSKEAQSDREADAANKAETKKQSNLAATSTAWHNGNNDNYVKVGTRR